jgi:uncharacterized membrane protein
MSFAWNGLLVGFSSLFKIHRILRDTFSIKFSWAIIFSVLILSSFGVYLGRFERWNSWDIVTNPFQLFDNIFHLVIHPFRNSQAVAVTIVFSAFLIVSYSTLFFFSKQHQHESPTL